MAYDRLKVHSPERAHKEYLHILYLAATESETGVDATLRQLLETSTPFTAQTVEALLREHNTLPTRTEVTVANIDLQTYDQLLSAAVLAGQNSPEVRP